MCDFKSIYQNFDHVALKDYILGDLIHLNIVSKHFLFGQLPCIFFEKFMCVITLRDNGFGAQNIHVSLLAEVSFLLCLLGCSKQEKSDLCHGSKFTVFTSCSHTHMILHVIMGSKECAGHSKLKSQSANISWGMRFERVPSNVVNSSWIKVSFNPSCRHLFSCTCQPSQCKRKEISTSREKYV